VLLLCRGSFMRTLGTDGPTTANAGQTQPTSGFAWYRLSQKHTCVRFELSTLGHFSYLCSLCTTRSGWLLPAGSHLESGSRVLFPSVPSFPSSTCMSSCAKLPYLSVTGTSTRLQQTAAMPVDDRHSQTPSSLASFIGVVDRGVRLHIARLFMAMQY
jgi:hypothetical protein